MPNVWITNKSGHDYSDSERFGELRALTIHDEQNPLQVDRIAYHLARGIGRYVDSKDDYLLISGSPTIVALAVYFWLRKFGECNLLQWNAKARCYELSTVTTAQLGNLLDQAIMGV